MEKTLTSTELLEAINLYREKESLDNYTMEQLLTDIEEEEFDGDVFNINSLSLFQVLGLLSYQTTYTRILAFKYLLRETHYTVSDFGKLHNMDLEYGEVIVLSKYCQKVSDTENKSVKTRINKNGKNVKMFDVFVLKKVMKIK